MFNGDFLKFYVQNITKFSIAYIVIILVYNMVPEHFLNTVAASIFLAFIFLNTVYYYVKKRYIELIIFLGIGIGLAFVTYR